MNLFPADRANDLLWQHFQNILGISITLPIDIGENGNSRITDLKFRQSFLNSFDSRVHYSRVESATDWKPLQPAQLEISCVTFNEI